MDRMSEKQRAHLCKVNRPRQIANLVRIAAIVRRLNRLAQVKGAARLKREGLA